MKEWLAEDRSGKWMEDVRLILKNEAVSKKTMVIREEIYQETGERLKLGDHQPYRRLEVGDGHLTGAALPEGWSPADFFTNDSSVLPKPKRDADGRVIYE